VLGSLGELADRVGGRVIGDASVRIERIAAIGESDAGTLTFATDERYLAEALRSPAAAVLVDDAVAPHASVTKPLLVVPSARLALAVLLQALRRPRPRGPFRHPSAVVESGAEIGADVYLGAFVYVGAGACIGDGCTLESGAYVGADSRLGRDCWLHPQARVLHECTLGDRVVLHAGSVIGSEGFGWVFTGNGLQRIPQVGNVVLGDDVEIGANTCVDRAQTGSTRIGTGTKIDNLCQIGHNCRIGEHSVLAALCGLAGSTVIGDRVKVGGASHFKGHITVGSDVTIAGATQVWGDIPDGAFVSGAPARDHRERLRLEVLIRNLPKLVDRVQALERALGRHGR
jgi:UDP-3-O-[3-hydroxymyristoyl] glucosamine N-acyltransferase